MGGDFFSSFSQTALPTLGNAYLQNVLNNIETRRNIANAYINAGANSALESGDILGAMNAFGSDFGLKQSQLPGASRATAVRAMPAYGTVASNALLGSGIAAPMLMGGGYGASALSGLPKQVLQDASMAAQAAKQGNYKTANLLWEKAKGGVGLAGVPLSALYANQQGALSRLGGTTQEVPITATPYQRGAAIAQGLPEDIRGAGTAYFSSVLQNQPIDLNTFMNIRKKYESMGIKVDPGTGSRINPLTGEMEIRGMKLGTTNKVDFKKLSKLQSAYNKLETSKIDKEIKVVEADDKLSKQQKKIKIAKLVSESKNKLIRNLKESNPSYKNLSNEEIINIHYENMISKFIEDGIVESEINPGENKDDLNSYLTQTKKEMINYFKKNPDKAAALGINTSKDGELSKLSTIFEKIKIKKLKLY